MSGASEVLISAVISGGVSLLGAGITFVTARQNLKSKLSEIHDKVTEELVRQRVGPYTDFMAKLEPMSRQHQSEITAGRQASADAFVAVLHDALYGSVGVLASSDTREILVYTRAGWSEYGGSPPLCGMCRCGCGQSIRHCVAIWG